MRNRFLAPIIAVLVAIACVSVNLARAQAKASTSVLTIPASVVVSPTAQALIQSCVGEPVTFVGDALLVIHRTILPKGSQLFLVHGNPQGVIALGQSSGTTYRVGGSDTLAQFVAPLGTFVGTATANLLVVGQGAASSFFGHILLHVTMTPEGEVTADILIFDIQCM